MNNNLRQTLSHCFMSFRKPLAWLIGDARALRKFMGLP